MKKKLITLFCIFAINGVVVADEIDNRLQTMITERNAITNRESYFAKNCSKQLAFLQKFANQGKANAQTLLGSCYYYRT